MTTNKGSGQMELDIEKRERLKRLIEGLQYSLLTEDMTPTLRLEANSRLTRWKQEYASGQ